MATETVKLNGKIIKVEPLSWGELPAVAERLARVMEGMDSVRMAFFKYVTADPKKQNEKHVLASIATNFPKLVDEALAAALRVEVAVLQKASPMEVMEAAEVCFRVHRFHELLAQAKKVQALLVKPTQAEPTGAIQKRK